MKSVLIFLFTALITAGIIAAGRISSIYGVIDPANAAKRVFAISTNKDTVVVIPYDGRFSIAVNGGTWKLHIEATAPYKDAYVENIKVTDGRSTDAGLIRLTK